MHPWIWSDEIAESFYNWMVKGFRSGGYQGGMVYVVPGRPAPVGAQSLAISIVRWRVNRDNSVEALISASYDAGDGVVRELGIVSGQSMSYFASQNRLSMDRAFDESAQDAARQLLARILPGP